MERAKKLPSGHWRAIADLGTDQNGKRIRKSFTATTKKAAEEAAKRCEANERDSMRSLVDKDCTVREAVEMYVKKKEEDCERGQISPSTIRSYRRMMENNIDDVASIPCLKLDDGIINKWIDSLIADDYSAKTIKNIWFLVRASLMDVLPRSRVIDFRVSLPSSTKRKVVVPTEEDIHKLLTYLRQNDYQFYCAVMLAAFGTLRRSEICALTADDIDRENCIVSVNKALVEHYNGGYVIKTTKTELSEREVELPAFVINALPEEGKIIDVLPAWITEHFAHTLKKLDIPHFRFHDLRHYSASIMHYLGATNETIMHRGGWASDYCLNQHYRGNMSEYDKVFTDKLNKHFESKFAM